MDIHTKIHPFGIGRHVLRTPRILNAVVAAATVLTAAILFRADVEPLAQRTDAQVIAVGELVPATQAMIDFAIGALRSASGHSVYAEKGIAEKGNSVIERTKTDAPKVSGGHSASKDLSNAINAIRQLPCTPLESRILSGTVFTPGVYCVGAAGLDGEIVLDGLGSTTSTFIFVIEGRFTAADDSGIRSENGAQAGNAFFVASDAVFGNGVSFGANMMVSGDINIGNGTVITERVLSLGRVEIAESVILGGANGSVRICVDQQLPAAIENNISNRVFHFTISGTQGVGTAADPVRVAVGTCSKLIPVGAGPQVVTELNAGSLISPPDGTFEGNFELTTVTSQTPYSPSTLGTVNLSTRTANINVVPGGPEGEISLRFTNRRAISGFVEICKQAAAGPGAFNPRGASPLSGGDPDVTGFFRFTVSGVYSNNQQNPNVKVLQVFTLPVGHCTGPIAVTSGDPPPFTAGSLMTKVSVSNLPRAGTYFESSEVYPSSRRASADMPASIYSITAEGTSSIIPAPGGGYVEAAMTASTSALDQTLVVFTSRSNPGRLKVCKIAGPGIPLHTLFQFTVTGIGNIDSSDPQTSAYGEVSRTFDVRAGDPGTGGSCEFAPGVGTSLPNPYQTFISGTPILVTEVGISPSNVIEQNPGQLRTMLIRQFGSAFSTSAIAGFEPNPETDPTTERISRASIMARSGPVEIDLTGFRFEPAILKVCIRGIGSAAGTNSHFSVNAMSPTIGGPNPSPMFPPFTQTMTIEAGDANSPEGNCSFVNASSLPGGAFNKGSTVNVSHSLGGGTVIDSITCPTCGTGSTNVQLNFGSITISGPNGMGQGINTTVFTKRIGPVCRAYDDPKSSPSCIRHTEFDFDGDSKADPAVISPATGLWQIAGSANGGQVTSRNFGIAGDWPVAADYDGDGRTDYAVWRPSNGTWYYQGGTGIYAYHQWGQPGDIPLTGDFNGDGRADFIIFRPSNASWYVRTTNDQFAIFQFGIPSDRPLTGDYDGDGRTDVGVFRNGFWYTLESTRGFLVTQFGQAGDFPLSGDYDGDGMDDNAVYRSGAWYVRSSSTYTATPLGFAGDIPAPADYDGDGKTDKAVFRPSSGLWLIRKTALGEAEVQVDLGGPGMVPAAAPYEFFGLAGN